LNIKHISLCNFVLLLTIQNYYRQIMKRSIVITSVRNTTMVNLQNYELIY